MLRLLYMLVFATISVVYCQDNCPAYSAFKNYPNKVDVLQSLFNGIFTLVYTSSTGGVDCHKVKYVTDTDSVTIGYSEFPQCCFKLDEIVFNSDQITYTIGPINGTQEGCSWVVKGPGSMKVLTTTGTGDTLCLILAVCEPKYYGIMVMCRGAAPQLLTIVGTLTNLLGSAGFSDIFALKEVKKASCALGNSYCPDF